MRKQFYQTALGNCYGLKLAKCWLQFKQINVMVLFIRIFGTFSFSMIFTADTQAHSASYPGPDLRGGGKLGSCPGASTTKGLHKKQ